MIVVFGSLNIDLSFPVDRLPRPGETVLGPGYLVAAGGKGLNQAVAAARAGAETRMIGCIGDDDFGRRLRALLADEGIGAAGLRTGTQPTACATISIDRHGQNAIVVGSGANREARASAIPDALLAPGTTLVLQNEVPIEETIAAARRARARGARVVLNLAPAAALDPETLGLFDVLVVNEIEAQTLVDGFEVGRRDDPEFAIHALAGLGSQTSVLTLGAAGSYATAGGLIWRVPPLSIEAVDSVGAGDAFVGVLAARLDAGDPLSDALRRASVAGALACLTAGAVPSMPAAAAIEARLGGLPAVRWI
ncbi:MAG: ribokinase [Alphaproteobacteria bacterium]